MKTWLLEYFPELTSLQLEQFESLKGLYEEWNAKINVISRKDIENFNTHHILHSLGIAKVMRFKAGSDILDIGTGGGFPGIPLAILFPDSNFLLVDSIGKKITVVNAIVEALQLKNVTTIHGRAEQTKLKFDFIVSRAVASLTDFMPWTNNKMKTKQINAFPNGVLYLKGGDLRAEYRDAKVKHPMEFDLREYFEEDYFETKKVVYIKLV